MKFSALVAGTSIGIGIGVAGFIAAAPASAQPGCAPKIACDAWDGVGQFQSNIGTFIPNGLSQFASSVDPDNVTDQLLNGTCTFSQIGNTCAPGQAGTPGLRNQLDVFADNFDQSANLDTFQDSINPAKNLNTFQNSINPAKNLNTFHKSVSDLGKALGPDAD